MHGHHFISHPDLFAALGTGVAPTIVDVCIDDDFADDPRLIPGSYRINHHAMASGFVPRDRERPIVVVCHKGQKLSQGAAAHLRCRGYTARALEGGRVLWAQASLPMVPVARIPERQDDGTTLWVTRERPGIDQVACAWLIRRFVDAHARFLFVADDEVAGVAERFGATPLDIPDVVARQRAKACSVEAMIAEFGLSTPALDYLAAIVGGADTERPDLAPEASGLAVMSHGLSRLCHDDLELLATAFAVYDALYLWCRDVRGETSNRPAQASSA